MDILIVLVFICNLSYSSQSESVSRDNIDTGNKHSIKIAAFNIQIFGKTKALKNDVMEDLSKIVKEFDITFIQEIRELKDTAMTKLLQLLNSNYGGVWAYIESPRLGRTSSKEQYAYVYNKSSVAIDKTYLYVDTKDYFERQPFGIKLNFYGKPIVLLGMHIDPDKAPEEISRLVDVYDDARRKLGTEDMLLLGDMNAGCGYVSKKAMRQIALRTDPRFTWLLEDKDTTVADSFCPYDRIIMAGKNMKNFVGNNLAKVYRFDEVLGLTQDKAKERSDHYPVYISIKDDGSAPTSKSTTVQLHPLGFVCITFILYVTL